MKFIVEPPQAMEATKIEVKEQTLEVTPVTVKGQHVVRAGYLTAVGSGGAESKAVILFNANTGDFTIQRTDGEPVAFDFDLPKAEFKKKREAARKSGKKGAAKAAANQQGNGGNDAQTN